MLTEFGNPEVAAEALGLTQGKPKHWAGLRSAARATPKASRVAEFIICWAIGLADEGGDFSITEYQRYWNENERRAYRSQKEFRELWPEYDTPDELARQLLAVMANRKVKRRDVASLPMKVQVLA